MVKVPGILQWPFVLLSVPWPQTCYAFINNVVQACLLVLTLWRSSHLIMKSRYAPLLFPFASCFLNKEPFKSRRDSDNSNCVLWPEPGFWTCRDDSVAKKLKKIVTCLLHFPDLAQQIESNAYLLDVQAVKNSTVHHVWCHHMKIIMVQQGRRWQKEPTCTWTRNSWQARNICLLVSDGVDLDTLPNRMGFCHPLPLHLETAAEVCIHCWGKTSS